MAVTTPMRRTTATWRAMWLFVGVTALGTSLTTCTTARSSAEPDLGPLDAVVDDKARAIWPGRVEPDGSRIVRRINGFVDGAQVGCWLFGLSSRLTADAFVFCREGDALCPFDALGHAQWQRMVGDPVFARMPGEAGYSPYWLVWVVRVPAGYAAGDLKSQEGIKNAAAASQVVLEQEVFDHGGAIGPGPAVMHCALVLAGTTLDGANGDIAGQPGVKLRNIDDRQGWHKQYRVHFYDFSASEGVGPADATSQSRPLMIVSDVLVLQRDCTGGSNSPLCATSGPVRGWVSELDADSDFTHDGDKSDTNHVFLSTPFHAPADPLDANRAYSPLWRVSTARVPASHDKAVALIDSTADQGQSAVKSIADLRALVAQGLLTEPEPLTEAQTGVVLPGNDGQVYLSCPVQVPANAP